MRVPLSWLKDYVDITLPVDELEEKLTLAGLEVENTEYVGVRPPAAVMQRKRMKLDEIVMGNGRIAWDRDKIYVGQIVEASVHPNADRLILATVDYGADQPMTIITGAPNLRPGDSGQKVAFATLGAILIDPYKDEFKTMKLKKGKIRGITSEGMACSERELGLSEEHEGIIILPADAPVGAPLADYLGDVVFDIDVTPNMIRIASIMGVAREVAALTGAPLHAPLPTWQTQDPPAGDYCDVEIIDSDLCYRFTATIIRDVQIKPSPFWMQHRLKLVGQRPISNLVDISNYVMFEWGKPTHAFDYDRLLARARSVGKDKVRIIVRRAEEGEQFTTLDGVKRTLDTDVLMIADEAGTVGIAGVMGGLETEVSDTTANVLLESASFNFINVRRTSRKLKLPSEAAYRFSRGVPSALDPIGNVRGAQLMADLGGGTIAFGIVEDYPRQQEKVVVPVTAVEVRRILGIELNQEAIVDILHRLEFETLLEDEVIWATVPWYRLDITIAADLLEEIARIYGYDRIPTTMVADALPPQRHNWPLELQETIRDILSGAGLQEIINYTLTSLQNHTNLYPDQPDLAPQPQHFVTLANPMSEDRNVLRRTLIVSALEDLQRNLRHAERIAVFELGLVYLPEGGDGLLPNEERRLIIAMTGPREPGSWLGGDPAGLDFFDLKGVVEVLMEYLGVKEVQYEPVQKPWCGPRCANIVIDGHTIGWFGEIHPLVRQAYNLPNQTVSFAEMMIDPLLPYFQQHVRQASFSDFPPVKEDIALIVDESIPAGEVDALIRQTAGPTLTELRLFDVYRGKPIESGKKSMAYALTFQSPTKTLTDKDTAKLRRKIVGRLNREIGAELREG